jgi:hypothetical protein
MSKKILDIGAGDNPDKRATHAVDELVTPKELKTAEGKSKKLEEYYEGDFRHPPKEMKQEFDAIISHFAPSAFEGKSASKALDYITKDDATAEIEVGISDAPKIVQVLHNAGFKILSIEAKEIPSVIPATKSVGGDVVIKAEKRKRGKEKSYYADPVKVRMPSRKISKQRRIIKHHKQTKPIGLRTARVG